MRSIALLATALFLASAPSPDPETISEMSAGFLSPSQEQPLLASETKPEKAVVQVASNTPKNLEADSADSDDKEQPFK